MKLQTSQMLTGWIAPLAQIQKFPAAQPALQLAEEVLIIYPEASSQNYCEHSFSSCRPLCHLFWVVNHVRVVHASVACESVEHELENTKCAGPSASMDKGASKSLEGQFDRCQTALLVTECLLYSSKGHWTPSTCTDVLIHKKWFHYWIERKKVKQAFHSILSMCNEVLFVLQLQELIFKKPRFLTRCMDAEHGQVARSH